MRLSNGAAKVIQGVEEADVVDEWAGYRPCTHDGLPILGAAPELEGLYIATGHAMMGMTLGPYSGVVIADLICGRTPKSTCTFSGQIDSTKAYPRAGQRPAPHWNRHEHCVTAVSSTRHRMHARE